MLFVVKFVVIQWERSAIWHSTERTELIMPRRGECIYKRKDGRWEARYVREITVDGKKKYGSVYASSYRAVKDKQQYLTLLPRQEMLCVTNIRMSQLVEEWLSHIHSTVKQSTYRKYEGLCRNHILPELGNVTLTMLSRAMIQSFTEALVNRGRIGGGALSAKTVNDILIIMGLLFDFAEEEHQIVMPQITLMREEKKEVRVLSECEQNRLIEYLLSEMDIYRFGTLIALFTGIRIGELCALLWEDITDSFVVINKTMQRLKSEDGGTEVVVDSPKSESSKRVIPLPEFLLPYVQQFRKHSGYVIDGGKSGHSEPRVMQQRFRKMANDVGLENVTFHTLRHTFATRCVEAGFDVKTLSEVLGHADVKTTLNRYVHPSFELKQKNMAKLTFLMKG